MAPSSISSSVSIEPNKKCCMTGNFPKHSTWELHLSVCYRSYRNFEEFYIGTSPCTSLTSQSLPSPSSWRHWCHLAWVTFRTDFPSSPARWKEVHGGPQNKYASWNFFNWEKARTCLTNDTDERYIYSFWHVSRMWSAWIELGFIISWWTSCDAPQ